MKLWWSCFLFFSFLFLSQTSFAEINSPGNQRSLYKIFIQKYIDAIKESSLFSNTEHDSSRRNFLRSAGGASVGAALMSGGSALDMVSKLGQKSTLPAEWLRRISRLKINGSLDKAGLEDYIKVLQTEIGKTNSPLYKRILEAKVANAQQSIVHIETIVDNSNILKNDPQRNIRRTDISERMNDPHHLNKQKERIKNGMDRLLEQTSSFADLELKILTARVLLDPILVRRIGMQISYTNTSASEYVIALSTDDEVLLNDYLEYLNLLEKKFDETGKARHGKTFTWLTNLQIEASLSIESLEISKKSLARSCSAIL